METIEVGPYEYHDKMPLKTGWAEQGVRVVPPATVAPGRLRRARRRAHALLRERRRVGRLGHDGRHVGDGRLVRADRHRRAPLAAASASAACSSRCRPARSSSRTAPSSARAASSSRACASAARPCSAPTSCSPPRRRSSTCAARSRSSCAARCRRAPSSSPARARRSSRPARTACPCALIIGERTASTDRKTSLTEALREHAVSV